MNALTAREPRDNPAVRSALLLALAACSFRPNDAAPRDAAAGAIDARDAPGARPCIVLPTGSPANAGVLGGSGGMPGADLACPAGQLPVGIGFDMSQNAISSRGNEQVAVAAHVACGAIARDASGAVTTTVASTIDALPGQANGCGEYHPTTVAVIVDCAPGEVIVALAGNRAGTSLYNTVEITCATVAADGTPTATTHVLPIAGTVMFSNAPQSVACPLGTAVVGFGVLTGCGQDELIVECGTLVCR
jgi:hypothetical protein